MRPYKFLSGHSERLIKVCGNRYPENISQVAALTPMLMGFIFYDRSPRSAIGLDPQAVRTLPHYIRPVGVFVNETPDKIEEICTNYGVGIVQLHGDEEPSDCQRLSAKGYVVFKAIGLKDNSDFERLKEYEQAGVTLFVFDTPTAGYGGSGRKFDWQLLRNYPLQTPYLLSGGIGENDVETITANMTPYMAGIDINSRFETEPGIKDIRKLTHFILSLRKFNENEPTGIPFWEKK
ncbi:MAG: phosphoribosylanthranilate isomerase [Paramuribaculum sp.]|nr:phosphoribosylanthranilate isomerase [Paramuribaculum sp.]